MSWVVLAAVLAGVVQMGARDVERGWASAYGPGVMEGVVALRFEEGLWRVQPPVDWYQVAGYVAVMDCSRVGEVTTVRVGGREWRVLVADCAGADGPVDRFSRQGIVLEFDWRSWERLTREYGRPLAVELTR